MMIDEAALALGCALCLGGLQHVVVGVVKTAELDERLNEPTAWILVSVIMPAIAAFLVACPQRLDHSKGLKYWPVALGPALLGCVAVYTGGLSASDPSHLKFGAIPIVLLQSACAIFGAWLRLRASTGYKPN